MMISAVLYLSEDVGILSSLSVSFFDPFLSGISHSWTKKGDTKNSTEQWYSYPTEIQRKFSESPSIFYIENIEDKKGRWRIEEDTSNINE